MNDIIDKVLEKIKDEHIQPLPKWRHWLRSWGIWVLAGLAAVVGAFAFAFLLFLLETQDWDVFDAFGLGFWERLWMSLPYLWIFVMAIFLVAVYYNVRHTKRGYRYSALWLCCAALFISLFGGFLLDATELSEKTFNLITLHVPFGYNQMDSQTVVWTKPQIGLLSGKVEMMGNKEFLLQSFDGHHWVVVFDGRTVYRGCDCGCNCCLKNGNQLKILGQPMRNGKFRAEEIRFWRKERIKP